MAHADLPRPLRPFLDEDGRFSRWPTSQNVPRMAAALLARRFVSGRRYSEHEVDDQLIDGHTFADWPLLRRALVDLGFLDRERDGSRYWLRADARERIARELPGSART